MFGNTAQLYLYTGITLFLVFALKTASAATCFRLNATPSDRTCFRSADTQVTCREENRPCPLENRNGECLRCWECNSLYDRRCRDDFDAGQLLLHDCSQRSLEHYPNENATVCRKIVQKVEGQLRYIRQCGFLQEERDDCYRKAGTFNAQIEYCHCNNGDGCNSAPSVTYGSVMSFVLTVSISIATILNAY